MADKKLMFIVGANVKDFQTKMNLMTKDLNKMSRDAQKALGPAMDFIGSAVKRIGIAGAAGFGAITGAGIKMNAELEQSKIGFTTMLGSAEKADAFLQQMRDFAARTPFEFNELQSAAKKMLAFGFAAENVEPMLTAVGDAVSGLGGGQEMIDRVTLALGQMQAKGKVSGEEMRQLAEAGIPAWQMLADKFGLTTGEVMKLSEKGLIPAGKAIDALVEGMNIRFGGMMEKQSKSMLGLWSTLKDTAKIFVTDVIEPTFEKARARFSEFMTKLEEWRNDGQLQDWARKAQDAFESFWSVASTVVKGVIEGGRFIVDHWNAIGPVLAGVLGGFLAYKTAIGIIQGVTMAQKALNLAMAGNPIGLLVVATAGLAAAGFNLWEKTNAATQAMQRQREEAKRLAEQQYAENRQIVELTDKYDGLVTQLDKAKKGTSDYEDISGQLAETKDALVKLMPDVVTAYDSEGKAIDINTGKLRENARAAEHALKVRNAQMLGEAMAQMREAQAAFRQFQAEAERRAAMGMPMLTSEYQKQLHALGQAVKQTQDHYATVQSGVLGLTEKIKGSLDTLPPAGQKAADGLGAGLDKVSEKIEKVSQAFSWQEFGLKKLEQGWQILQSSYPKSATEAQKLADQQQYLNDKLFIVNESLAQAQKNLQYATANFAENSREVQDATLAVGDYAVQQAELQKQLNETSEAIKAQTKTMDVWDERRKQMNAAIEAGDTDRSLQIAITGALMDQWNKGSLQIGNVPKFAEGGVITRPVLMTDLATGMPAGIAGEAGDEFLVPDLPGGGSTTGPTIIYNQNAPVYGMLDFDQRVKQTIRDGLQGGAFRGLIPSPTTGR